MSIKKLGLLIFLFSMNHAKAADLSVIDVRRNIPLADKDPVYKDFYINGGSGAGLKVNTVVMAVRKMTVKDATGAQSIGDLEIPVGQLKIIFVNEKIAVAREYKAISRDNEPMLEQMGIMNGDLIETKGSFVDNAPPPAKKTVKKEEAKTEEVTAAPAPASVNEPVKQVAKEASVQPTKTE